MDQSPSSNSIYVHHKNSKKYTECVVLAQPFLFPRQKRLSLEQLCKEYQHVWPPLPPRNTFEDDVVRLLAEDFWVVQWPDGFCVALKDANGDIDPENFSAAYEYAFTQAEKFLDMMLPPFLRKGGLPDGR